MCIILKRFVTSVTTIEIRKRGKIEEERSPDDELPRTPSRPLPMLPSNRIRFGHRQAAHLRDDNHNAPAHRLYQNHAWPKSYGRDRMARRLILPVATAIGSLFIRWLGMVFGNSSGTARANRVSHQKHVPGAGSEPHCIAPGHDA